MHSNGVEFFFVITFKCTLDSIIEMKYSEVLLCDFVQEYSLFVTSTTHLQILNLPCVYIIQGSWSRNSERHRDCSIGRLQSSRPWLPWEPFPNHKKRPIPMSPSDALQTTTSLNATHVTRLNKKNGTIARFSFNSATGDTIAKSIQYIKKSG